MSFNKKRALILSGIKWNDTLQRHQSIAVTLTELGYVVYFVEGIISSSFSVKKLFNHFKCLKTDNKELKNDVPQDINIISAKYVNPNSGIFRAINCRETNKVIDRIGETFDLVINYLPIYTTYDFLNKIKYEMLIYDCVRDFQNWGGYPKDIQKIESWLGEKADYIFTDSYYLTNKMIGKWGDKVFQILPTIDNSLCNEQQKDLSEIRDIGYVGTLGKHIDVCLLKKLVNRGYRFHLFGRVEIPLDFEVANHGYYSDLKMLFAQVFQSVDAIIIPYKGNMDGVIPAKTMQCLASGLPVFISEFYDSRRLEQYMYVYKNDIDLMGKIANFNKEDFLAKRSRAIGFIQENTTGKLMDRLGEILNEHQSSV